MSDKQYPSNLYLESAANNIDFAKQVSVEAVVVMAKELLALRKVSNPCQHKWDTLRLVEANGGYQYCTLCGNKKVAAAPTPHE